MPATELMMPTEEFLEARKELLRLTARMSCSQALDLADLLHTVIRMRKPHRPLRNLDLLFCEDAASAA